MRLLIKSQPAAGGGGTCARQLAKGIPLLVARASGRAALIPEVLAICKVASDAGVAKGSCSMFGG